jgi:type I restriction enzyme M protein
MGTTRITERGTMPPRKRARTTPDDLPGTTGTKQIRDILWKAADKLRGSMDAAQYKEFVLGLVFLKYVSDAFAERREQIAESLVDMPEKRRAAFLDDRDEYTAENVFWVPAEARWEYLAENASSAEGGVGKLLDDAMDAVMRTNPALTGVLPKIFNRDNVDPKRLKELVDLIGDARFTGHGDRPAQDVLGEVYEYFLEKFARAEGKRAGEFYTPASVVRLLVEILEPYQGRVYDPCCGSGGMFVQAGKFVAAHAGRDHSHDLAVYGQEANERTWRLAKMNLAIHGIDPNGVADRWADTFVEDKHPDLRADFVLANPPFNMSDWARKPNDPRWRFGAPPQSNANFAWLQHIIFKLGERGSAGVVLSNGSMSSQQSGEGEIRASLVDADLIACMVALPGNLFRSTAIPACLWFLTKDKTPQGAKALTDRRGEVLFIDARGLGTMVDRTERVFTDEDLAQVAHTYHAWRGTRSARKAGKTYEDVPGFCYSARLQEVAANDHILTPGRYVGTAEVEEDPDAEPIADRIARLAEDLIAHFDESARIEGVVRERLRSLDV